MRYDILQQRARSFLEQWTQPGEVVVIAPTREAVDDLVRGICTEAIIGVHRFSVRQFIQAVSSRGMNELGLVPVTAIVREAIATRVVAEALRGGKLTHFSGVAEFPGFPRSLTKTLDDLRLNR